MAEDSPKTDGAGPTTRLQHNVIWWALGLIVAGAVGAAGVVRLLDDHVSHQIALSVKPQVIEALGNDPELKRLSAERQTAADAVARGNDAQQRATAKFAEAMDAIDKARQAATQTLALADQLKRLTDISELGAKIDQALAQPEFRDAVVSRVMPAGAIISFNAQGCPPGWKSFEGAKGRVLVGAGVHQNLDRSGKRLLSYDIGVTGGDESHSITVEEMPAHSHSLSRNQTGTAGNGMYPSADVMGSTAPVPVAQTGSTGGSKPFSIMPPYIALQYCEKI